MIPYAGLIAYPPNDIRARRDFDKLLNLIKVIAFLHQKQREIKQWENGEEYIEATLLDYELAYDIAKETFVETQDDLDKRSRRALEVVRDRLEEQAKQEGKKIEDLEFDRDKAAAWCGKKKHKLNPVFQELEEKEYFLQEETRPITNWGTGKRIYRLNTQLLNGRPIFEGLTTPEELKKKWEEGQADAENSLGNKEPSDLSLLSPLSHGLEEKK